MARRMRSRGAPRLEDNEQAILCMRLAEAGIRFHSTPNEGAINFKRIKRLKAMGLRPGYPDLTIDTPPLRGGFRSVHVEMKRDGRQGERNGGLSENQVECKEWLEGECGDLVIVAYGAIDAIEQLQGVGYAVEAF